MPSPSSVLFLNSLGCASQKKWESTSWLISLAVILMAPAPQKPVLACRSHTVNVMLKCANSSKSLETLLTIGVGAAEFSQVSPLSTLLIYKCRHTHPTSKITFKKLQQRCQMSQQTRLLTQNWANKSLTLQGYQNIERDPTPVRGTNWNVSTPQPVETCGTLFVTAWFQTSPYETEIYL